METVDVDYDSHFYVLPLEVWSEQIELQGMIEGNQSCGAKDLFPRYRNQDPTTLERERLD